MDKKLVNSAMIQPELQKSETKMVSSICFVPHGCFSLTPKFARVSQEEVDKHIKELEHKDGDTEMKDKEEEDNPFVETVDFQQQYFNTIQSNVITDGKYLKDGNDLDEMKEEDYALEKTDTMILTATNAEDFSTIDVYIFPQRGNTYLHHNVILGSYALCIEWMNFHPESSNAGRNMVAVGTFSPDIEVWDVDVIDDIRPSYKLCGHKGGVLSVSWNRKFRNLLASGSEDSTVKVWDCQKGTVSGSTDLGENVVRVKWNQKAPTILACAGIGKKCLVFDPSKKDQRTTWSLPAAPEDIEWNPFNVQELYVALENGYVACYDIRKISKPVLTFKAHEAECNALSFSQRVPNMAFTCGSDSKWKCWNLKKGKLFFSKEVVSGGNVNIFDIKCYNNLLAVGGENLNTFYNLFNLKNFRSLFQKYVKGK